MKNVFSTIALSFVVISCTSPSDSLPHPHTALLPVPEATIQAIAATNPALPSPLPSLSKHLEKAIQLSRSPISEAEAALTIDLLTSIAERTFEHREHQEYWLSLIGVESAYDQRAKSQVGATGLGQLMPQYYQDLAASCGILDLPADTINDRYINARISACHFRHLIEEANGVVSLALVAYNAGINSQSYQRAGRGGVPVTETAGYVTKTAISVERTRSETLGKTQTRSAPSAAASVLKK